MNPITITLPSGSTIQSTHTCNLDIPWLPHHVTEAHIVPGLAHSSLVSTRKFCAAGCKVAFDEDECRVYYQGRLALVGGQCPITDLWRLPINPISPHKKEPSQHLNVEMRHNKVRHTAATSLYTLPYKQQQMKYMHQTFFNLPPATILKAISNDQLSGIPLMKPDLIRRYLAQLPATPKGRMKRPRPGIRSTKVKKTENCEPVKIDKIQIHPNAIRATTIPPDNVPDSNIFCYAALADKQQGTLYTDATGALPARSMDANQYYFIAYDYNTTSSLRNRSPMSRMKRSSRRFRLSTKRLWPKGTSHS